MPNSNAKADSAATARLLVVLLAFAWGLNWIAAAFALREISPWSLRSAGSSIGAITLLVAAVITGHNLRIPRGEYVHIMIRSEEHTSELQSRRDLVCRLLLEKINAAFGGAYPSDNG